MKPAGEGPPRRPLPRWLLGLAGLGLFVAGALLGTIMTISVTLYRAPTSPAVPLAATAGARTTAPTTALPPPATPTPWPTPTPVPVGPSVGHEAPDFTLVGLDGVTCTLSAYRGKTVVVNFWASWCPPCRQEWPELRTFAASPAYSGVVILAVNVEEPVEAVRKFAGDEALPFPILLDSDGQVNERYRVTVLPTTFLIDPQGHVLQVIPGNLDVAALEQLVRR